MARAVCSPRWALRPAGPRCTSAGATAAMMTPASSTTTVSEMPITTPMSCSTRTTATPLLAMRRRSRARVDIARVMHEGKKFRAAACDREVLAYGHRAEELRRLVGARDAGAGDAPRRAALELAIADTDAAGIRPVEAAQHVEHRGLAGAVRADHAGHFSRLGAQRDIARRPHAAERDAEVLDLERRAPRWRELHLASRNDAGLAPPRGQARDEAGDAVGREPEHRQQQRAEEEQPVLGERGKRLG